MMKEAQLHQPVAISEGGATVLISFATTEGQTRKIAERISANLRERGYEAKLYDTAVRRGVPEVGALDAVIVAASIHEGHHQDSAINFAFAHRDQLVRKPSAFVSVSLSAAMPNGQAEAQHYVDRFVATTGWSPAKTLLLGGALRWSECDYFQRRSPETHSVKRRCYSGRRRELRVHGLEGPPKLYGRHFRKLRAIKGRRSRQSAPEGARPRAPGNKENISVAGSEIIGFE